MIQLVIDAVGVYEEATLLDEICPGKGKCENCELDSNRYVFSHPSYGCSLYGSYRGPLRDAVTACLDDLKAICDKYGIDIKECM